MLEDSANVDTIDEYQDTYHLTAIEEINKPYQIDNDEIDDKNSTLQKLVKPKNRPKHSPMLSVLLILLGLVCIYYFWIIYSSTSFDISSKFKAFTTLVPYELNLMEEPEVIESKNMVSIEDHLISTAEKQNQQTIQSLLNLANTQIIDKKLSTPPSDNALNTYQMILQFDPHHEEALQGIQLIQNKYKSWAKLDIEQGKINRAKYFLQRAIDISPEDKESHRLLASLD